MYMLGGSVQTLKKYFCQSKKGGRKIRSPHKDERPWQSLESAARSEDTMGKLSFECLISEYI